MLLNACGLCVLVFLSLWRLSFLSLVVRPLPVLDGKVHEADGLEVNSLAAAAQILELVRGDVARPEHLEKTLLVLPHVLVDEQGEERVVLELVRRSLSVKAVSPMIASRLRLDYV